MSSLEILLRCAIHEAATLEILPGCADHEGSSLEILLRCADHEGLSPLLTTAGYVSLIEVLVSVAPSTLLEAVARALDRVKAGLVEAKQALVERLGDEWRRMNRHHSH
jgi:hypothetical protein